MIRSLVYISGMVLLCGMLAGTHAAERSSTKEQLLSLEGLVQEAVDKNPEIQGAAQRLEAAKAVIPQVQTLPDPKINLEYRDLTEREAMYGVTQELPFPGKLGLKGEVASRQADQVEQEYLAVRLRVMSALKQAYYDLHFVHKSIEIVEKNKELLRQFEETAKARYAVGQGAQQDVFRAQAEVSRVLARLATLEQRKQSLHAEINRLLNHPPADPLGRPEEIQMTKLNRKLEELSARIDPGAPLLRAQVKGVERGDKSVDLARRDYYPDFEVGAMGLHEEPTGTDGYRVMLNIRVPLYYAAKQREGVREAVAGREAARDELQTVRQELLFRMKDNVAQTGRSEELVAILEGAIIPQGRLTLASAQAGYGVGKVDFLTLLNSLLTLQESELELHGEIVEHEKARARIEEIIGERP
jgi:outer membrane protein, heavy metal efflux system